MTAWKKIQGSQAERPSEIDTTASAAVVYQRRNIERITVENDDGTKTDLWQYEERQMSYKEYSTMTMEQGRADIDYLSMMTGIDLPN